MKDIRRMACALLFAFATTAIAANDVAGVRVDDETTVAGQRLVLNGAGVRTRVVFKVYVAALYLRERKDNTKDVLALPGAKRVAVSMLRDVSSDDLGNALLAGIRKNSTPAETTRFGPQLLAMGEIFGRIPKLTKGQTFSVDWVPASGTVVLVDGKPVADPIPEAAFYDAILRIWLGDDPADASLKPAMLGAKASN